MQGFSSHQYSVSVETELVATADIPAEAARAYDLLQSHVDEQMQRPGFVPPSDYGMDPAAKPGEASANGSNGSNGARTSAGDNGTQPVNNTNASATPLEGRWKCSDKQRELILEHLAENQLDKHQIEALAVERFGYGVRLLNKVEASGLIDELLGTHGNNGHGNANGSAYRSSNGRRAAARPPSPQTPQSPRASRRRPTMRFLRIRCPGTSARHRPKTTSTSCSW